MRRMLLTGGDGFIGRNIKESYLAKEYTIFAPSHKVLDLTDSKKARQYIKECSPDVIVHAAVDTTSDNIIRNNITMYYNLLRNQEQVRKIINLSSGALYDAKRRALRFVQEHEIGDAIPEDDYGYSKLICNALTRDASNAVDLILFGVFGKYEKQTRFISQAIMAGKTGKPLQIPNNRFMDFISISDLIRVISLMLSSRLECKEYNITSGAPISLLALSKLVEDRLRRPVTPQIASDVTALTYSGDATRIQQKFPYFVFTPLMKSIEDFIGESDV